MTMVPRREMHFLLDKSTLKSTSNGAANSCSEGGGASVHKKWGLGVLVFWNCKVSNELGTHPLLGPPPRVSQIPWLVPRSCLKACVSKKRLCGNPQPASSHCLFSRATRARVLFALKVRSNHCGCLYRKSQCLLSLLRCSFSLPLPLLTFSTFPHSRHEVPKTHHG